VGRIGKLEIPGSDIDDWEYETEIGAGTDNICWATDSMPERHSSSWD